jgi:hypothetical protein
MAFQTGQRKDSAASTSTHDPREFYLRAPESQRRFEIAQTPKTHRANFTQQYLFLKMNFENNPVSDLR